MGGDQPLSLPVKTALATEVLVSYAQVRWALKRHGLPATLKRLRTAPRPPSAHRAPRTAHRYSHIVTRTLAPLPTDTRCLMQSLVLTRVLARRGIVTRLVIGVHPGERFAAHAWVEHDGAALLPTGGSDFDELVTL